MMQDEILLMVDPVGDQIFPVSRRAFSVITVPVARFLARNCVALFLDQNGRVSRIENVTLDRPGLFTKLGLWLGRPASAKFQFEPVDALLDDMKTMILDAMSYTRKRGVEPDDWWLLTAPESEVSERVNAASGLAELYQAITFPKDRDCLDLL